MQNVSTVEELFEKIVEVFPYDLQSTGVTQGHIPYDAEVEEADGFNYAEEFTFVVGKLLDEKLTAGGWIEVNKEYGEISVYAFFGIARNYEWEEKNILSEGEALHGWHDPESLEWHLEIGPY